MPTVRELIQRALAHRERAAMALATGFVWYQGRDEQEGPQAFMRSDHQGTGLTAWYLPPDDTDFLRGELKKAWSAAGEPGVAAPASVHASDLAFMQRLRAFLSAEEGYRHLYVPKLEFVRWYDRFPKGLWIDCSVYRFKGYAAHDLTREPGVDVFLELLLAGAHLVFLDGDVSTALAELAEKGRPKKHAHYFQTGDAVSYPNLLSGDPPAPSPILCAMLSDVLPGGRSSFLQVEGWPYNRGADWASFLKHGGDALTHAACGWNLSTYGLSPYSERRGTTVFLSRTRLGEIDYKTRLRPLFETGFDGLLLDYPRL